MSYGLIFAAWFVVFWISWLMVQPLWTQSDDESEEKFYKAAPKHAYIKRKLCVALLLSLVITGIMVAADHYDWIVLNEANAAIL